MGRFGQSVLYGLIVTISGGSFYYFYAVLMALANGTSVIQAFVDTLIGCLVCWAFFTFVFYEIAGALKKLNTPRRRDDQDGPGTGDCDNNTPKGQ